MCVCVCMYVCTKFFVFDFVLTYFCLLFFIFQTACYARDLDELLRRGSFFVGYDKYVWGVIFLQAAGGLVSMSVCLSVCLSVKYTT